jgi:hypothetical protein
MTTLTSTHSDPELKRELKLIHAINYSSDNVPFLQREGALAVNQLASDYAERGTLTDKTLLALVLTRLHDLQVRDFAMGMTTDENIALLASLWRAIVPIAPAHYIAPVAVLYSVTCYELGDSAGSQAALDTALADDSKYPMAKLLRRVYAAGWPPQSFRQMRQDLHPQVCAALGVASDS